MFGHCLNIVTFRGENKMKKIEKILVMTLVFTIVAVGFVSCVNAQEHKMDIEYHGNQTWIDTNGDRWADIIWVHRDDGSVIQKTIDTNHDLMADIREFDCNGDGIADIRFVDTDFDGCYDTKYYKKGDIWHESPVKIHLRCEFMPRMKGTSDFNLTEDSESGESSI
jgi:hypothetical protein